MNSNKNLCFWIQPGARKNEVVGEVEGAIKVKISAPPVEGKANEELVAFLAKSLGVRKSAISIVSGETSRRKIVNVEGLDSQRVKEILLKSK